MEKETGEDAAAVEAEAVSVGETPTAAANGAIPQSAIIKPPNSSIDVVLGANISTGDDVVWRVSIKSNPHLMVAGLPGMGKTTALINICRQLRAGGLTLLYFLLSR